MRGDRARGQEHALADLAVGQSLGGQAHDLPLLGGQLLQPGRAAGVSRHRDPQARSSDSARCSHGPARSDRNTSQGRFQLGFRGVDPAASAQPLAEFEAELRVLERPLVPGRVARDAVRVGIRRGRVSEDGVRAGGQLAQAGRGGPGVGERLGDPLERFLPVRAGACAGGGERQVRDRQVRRVIVVGVPVVIEQPAQVAEGREVVAVGEVAQAKGVPCPRSEQAAVLGVGGQPGGDQRPGGGCCRARPRRSR